MNRYAFLQRLYSKTLKGMINIFPLLASMLFTQMGVCADSEPRYVLFQYQGMEGDMPVLPDLPAFVAELKEQFGASPADAVRHVGFTPGLISSLNLPVEALRSRVNQALDVAEQTGMPVFFHMDDMHFWWQRKDLHSDPECIEWSDFPVLGKEQGPVIERYWLNWGSFIVFPAPPPNFESPRFKEDVKKHLAEGMGKPIVERLARWKITGKGYLFAGIAVGNETETPYDLRPLLDTPAGAEPTGQDVSQGQPKEVKMRRDEMVRGGFHALQMRGYTREKVEGLATEKGKTYDEVISELRHEVAHDYTEFRSRILHEAGVPRERIYTHFVSSMRSFIAKHMGGIMVDRFPDIKYSVNSYSRPGYTLTRNTTDLVDLSAKLKEARSTVGNDMGTAWAGVETYCTTEQPGRPQTREEYEAYLGGLFAHDMCLINVYGWNVPQTGEGSQFSVKNAPGVIEAIQNWISGKALPTDWVGEPSTVPDAVQPHTPGSPPQSPTANLHGNMPSPSLLQKVQGLEQRVQAWVISGGDPKKFQPLAQQLGSLLQAGNQVEAEKVADQILAIVSTAPVQEMASKSENGINPNMTPATLPQKVQGLEQRVQAWVMSGGDPQKVQPLGQQLGAHLGAGNQVEAEKVVDQILAIISAVPGQETDTANQKGMEQSIPVPGPQAFQNNTPPKSSNPRPLEPGVDTVEIPEVLRGAQWIWCEGEAVPQNFYLYCRKRFTVESPPREASVHVTADSRYILYVNDVFVGCGPCRADQRYQYYETYDLTPFLKTGENVISAIVHQYGVSTHSYTLGRGGFLLGAEMAWEGGNTKTIVTDGTWRVLHAPTWKRPTPRVCPAVMWIEEYDARQEIEGWRTPGFDDSKWLEPVLLGKPPVSPWERLIPRDIPPLLEREEFPVAVVDQGTVGDAPQHAVVRFAEALGATPGIIIYLHAWLNSSVEQRVGLLLMSQSQMPQIVSLGGLPVQRSKNGGTLELDLKAGWNELLIKSLRLPDSSEMSLALLPLNKDPLKPIIWYAKKDTSARKDTVSIADPYGPAAGPSLDPGQALGQPFPPENSEYTGWKPLHLNWEQEDNVAVRMHFETLSSGPSASLKNPEGLLKNDGNVAIIQTAGTSDAYAVLDFGKVTSGFVRLKLNGVAGGIIDLGYSEVFENGRTDILREGPWYFADRYIMKDGPQEWELFFWKGFRYLQLDFRNCGKPIEVESVSLNFTSYPVEYRGAFECSDDLLNKIWNVGRHTLEVCMHDGYEDTPWREQGQWLGDAQVEMLSNYYAFGDLKLGSKCLRQFAEGQTRSGLIPANWPADLRMWPEPDEHPFGIPTFMAQWVTMILEYDLYSGDRALMTSLYPHLLRLMDYFEGFINRDGLLEDVPGFVFLDWTPDSELMDMPPASKGVLTGMNCHYRRALLDAAIIAGIMGDEEHRSTWRKLAAIVKEQINTRFWDEERGIYIHGFRDGQPISRAAVHDSVLAIYADIAPPDRANRALDNLFGTSPVAAVQMGSPFFYHFYLQAFRKTGRDKEALVNTRRDYGKMLDAGATTWWEHFNGMASRSHAWSTGPSYDLSANVLGVTPLESGFSHFRVAPEPSDLTWAKGVVPTPKGNIDLHWELENGNFVLTVNAPFESEFELSVPAADLASAKLDGESTPTRQEYSEERARFWVNGPGQFVVKASKAPSIDKGPVPPEEPKYLLFWSSPGQAGELVKKIGMKGDGRTRLLAFGMPTATYEVEEHLPELIRSAFAAAKKNDIAVMLHFDFHLHWKNRPDLWNWFDPDQPGYNPDNKYNVEWHGWDGPPNKVRYLDYGMLERIAPHMCFTSDKVRAEITRIVSKVIGPVLREEIDKLKTTGKEALFAGVLVGLEPGVDDYSDPNPEQAKMMKEDGVLSGPLGYRALLDRGFGVGKPPADFRQELAKIIQETIAFWCKQFVDAGIPSNKLYPHVAAPAPIEMTCAPIWTAFNEYCRPGWSTYAVMVLAPNFNAIYDELAKHGNPPWAGVEANAGFPGSVVDWETYLGWHYNHGCVLVGVNMGATGEDLPKRLDDSAFGEEALAAYHKFLDGQSLVEKVISTDQPQFRIETKMMRVQKAMRRWLASGKPPLAVAKLLEGVQPLMEAKKYDEIEKLLDQALEMLGENDATPSVYGQK